MVKMTKQSDELKEVIRKAHELDSATAAKVLVIVDDSLEEFREEVREFKRQMRETDANVQKRILDTKESINLLASQLIEYRLERNTSELEKAQKDLEIAKRRATLTTSEIKAVERIVTKAVDDDKVDIRGIKIPSRLLPWLIVGVFTLLVLMLFVFPDTIAQILLRLAGT